MEAIVDILAPLRERGFGNAGHAHRLDQIIEGRVLTPPIHVSWITATSAFSTIFLGSRKPGN